MSMDGTERRRNQLWTDTSHVKATGGTRSFTTDSTRSPAENNEPGTLPAPIERQPKSWPEKLAKETVERDDGNRSLTFGA